MTRPLDTNTKNALDWQTIPMATLVYLDIENDPLYAWTGMGNLVFSAGQTGDSGLDGKTFMGVGTIASIGALTDGAGGSDALEIALPGVDITQPILKQLLYDRRRWQGRRAIVWLLILDPTTNAIVGKPFRVKTGRIDRMPYTEDKNGGTVKCRIEGQQAWGKRPLLTRYSEQSDINSTDNSQNWIWSLANMVAAFGKNSAVVSSVANGGSIGSGNSRFQNNADYV